MQRWSSDDSEITQETRVPQELLGEGAEQRGTLTVLVGGDVGATFAINSQAVLIGRNPRAHVPLEDTGVSRNQARILARGSSYEIEDMGSTNGTFVDGERVVGRVELRQGARIQMGGTVLRFAWHDEIELHALKQVYEASVRDHLTRTFNRRYFEERLIHEYAYAARHGSALCVAMIDIDHFKRVNDQHGHGAGDRVLRTVGEKLAAALRAEDVLARYGGEEFVVMARGIDPGGARALAERVRLAIERADVVWEGTRIPVTASVGLAHNHTGPAASDPQRLVIAADKALYDAKNAGRNRVVIAHSAGRYAVVSERPPKRRAWDKQTTPFDSSEPPTPPLAIETDPKKTQ